VLDWGTFMGTMLGQRGNEMFPSLGKLPSFFAVLIAVILFGLGRLFDRYGVHGPLADFTAYLDASLRSFDATTLGRTFYQELTGCVYESGSLVCTPGPDTTDALLGEPRNGLFASILVAVINTAAFVFENATWLGIAIYAITLVAAAVLVAKVIDIEESGFVGILLIVVLTPAVASLGAWALQWPLLLFVLLFSKVLAGIVWLITAAGGLVAWLNMGSQVLSDAHEIDKLKASLNPPPDSSNR
jgi:hypothetical protein